MKRKKLLIVLLCVLLLPVLFLGAGIAGLYTNQKRIAQMAIAEINETFVGKLVVNDSHISVFADFPYISIDLEGVRFYETKAADTKPLYEVEDLYVGFDIWDILNSHYYVKSLRLEGGHLDVIQHANGDINLMLAKGIKSDTTTTTEEEEDFHFELKEIHLRDFTITKRNEGNGQFISMHLQDADATFRKGKGHIFSSLDTRFVLDVMENDSISFFKNKHIELHTTIDYDTLTQMLTISPSKLKLEEALFALAGSIDLDDDMNLDLTLTGEKPDFSLFAAFAPNDLSETLKRYTNKGKIFFDGHVKGKSTGGHTPFVEVNFGGEDIYFIHTEAGRKLDDLRFKGYYSNGEGRSLQTTIFRLENVYAKPEQGIFKGHFLVSNFDDPQIAVNMNADLDLEFLAQFFELEGLENLKGQVVLNMDFDELIDIDKPEASLAQLKKGISSDLLVRDLSFKSPHYPHAIRQVNAHAEMEAGRVRLDSISFRIADSDFFFSGSLNDLPAIFHKQSKPVKFDLASRSRKIDFSQLLAFDKELAKSTSEVLSDFAIKLAFETSVDELLNASPLPKGEFFIKDFYGKLKHYPHTFHDFDADILITEKDLKVKNFSGMIDETDFHFNGALNGYKLWFADNKKGDTRFEFDFTSDKLKVHDLLSYEGENYLPEDYRDEVLSGLKLHGRLELHYDSLFQSADFYLDQFTAKMKLHPLKMDRFAGRVHYENEHLQVQNFKGQMGRSDFNVNLAYYTGTDKKVRKRDNFFVLRSNHLDLDELMNYHANDPTPHEDSFNIFKLPFTDISCKADVKKINYHKYYLEDARASLRLQEDHYLYVDTLSMRLAGGSMALKGYFNGSNPEKIYFNSTLTAHHLDLDQLMVKFDNFGQDYMINENLHGLLSGTVKSNVRMHPDLTPILKETDAHMELVINKGSIVNFSPLQAVAGYFKDKNLNHIRFDTLQNTMDLKAGVLHIPVMNINSSIGFMEVSGKQSLDMDMDYFVRVPWSMVTQVGASALFGGKKKEEVDPGQVDEIVYRDTSKRVRFVNLRITGNSDDFKVSLGKDKVPAKPI